MKHFTIRRGDRPAGNPEPSGPIEETAGVTSVAILGEDWPGLRPHMQVEIGSRVRQGQVLFTDRRHPAVKFVSPISGVVDSLTHGPRRTLDALVVQAEMDADMHALRPGESLPDDPRARLLAAGFWPAFRARPFGSIPAPDAIPDAVVINAVRAAPQAPDPVRVLGALGDDFHAGCRTLTQLTDGLVHLCQSPGEPLGPADDRIRHTSFSGTVAAGLSGTQIDRLCQRQTVWNIGYQDVAALGHFLANGTYLATRVVSVIGHMATVPRLLRVPLGARIADLTDESPVVAISGTPAAGREAIYLGRFDEQLTLLPSIKAEGGNSSPSRKPGHTAAIATFALEHSIAVDVLSIPLLRALSVGDTEAAEQLGCLALIEEDLATATRHCTSGVDYGACLRRVLNDLMAEAA